jgi:peptide/nickel transport system substrate-binding protein
MRRVLNSFTPLKFRAELPRALALVAGAALSLAAAACGGASNTSSTSTPPNRPGSGRAIVASLRTDPRSFNRYFANDVSSDLVAELTHARLLRIHKQTWEVEPWLAESWTESDDHLRYTLKLRSGVSFSDGQPFTSDDVVFTFRALYDPKSVGDSVLADAMMINGKPLKVEAPDSLTVVLTFPEPFAPGVRLLDNIPMLPKHKLEAAVQAGTFAKAWGLTTPPADIAGLGPFVLKEYVPGQRTVFERNPHYWRKAPNGDQLPYLDRITVETIPDQNAEELRLESGQLDLMSGEVPAEMFAGAKRAGTEGKIVLAELGMDRKADGFWINLRPDAFKGDPRASWIKRDEFRRAISMAIDRRAFVDTVFFGAGEPVYGPVTAAVRPWHWSDMPEIPYDPEGARKLLASIGAANARFQLMTQPGRPRFQRPVSDIATQLKKIGVQVDIVNQEGLSVVARIVSGDYEAVYFAPGVTDIDPAVSPDFWFSRGSAHFWNPNQKTPATAWEKQIDDLMAKQGRTFDIRERKRLFDEVQRVFFEHQPVIYFAAQKFNVAMSTRLVNAKPALHWIPILWNADQLSVR